MLCPCPPLLLLLATSIAAFQIPFQDAGLGSNLNLLGTSFGVPGGNATFDYVVVGGGTAGLVVASRLAASNNSVAVIEAGGFYEVDNGNLSVIPADASFFSGGALNDFQPLIDWGFATTPQPQINGRRIHYTRGKCLGGSSARNYLAYQRGTVDSYARWALEVGDPSYKWPALLPFFQKSVNFTPADNSIRASNASVSFNPAAFSPAGGPLQVSFPNWANPFSSWFRDGMRALGLPDSLDMVSGVLNGTQYQMNTFNPSDAARSSSESSFLREALARTDLTVYKQTMAKRILFDANKTASGVLVDTMGLQYTLNANKEVILSAGVFQSPQLLMVSGIGPKSTLEELSIPVVQDLPGVGQNLWDHYFFGPSYQVDVTTHSSAGNPVFLAEASEQYRHNQTALLTNSGADIFGFQKLPEPERSALSPATRAALATFPPDWPELEYLVIDAYIGNQLNYITGAPHTPFQYVGPAAALVAPLSRGNVTINSTDTKDQPLISPNWLEARADQDLAVAAFKRLRQFMANDATAPVVVTETFPGLNVSTDADILEFIKNNGLPIFHACATCKMGRREDPLAVVDSRARVFGVCGLRVVDASAFPFLPPGHPQSTVYALAEKISDDILHGQ